LQETKHCPFCGEEILNIAIKCKHCGSMLSGETTATGEFTSATQVRLALANKYEIIEEIGRGGMATVYKARQKNLDRIVAIKVLPPQFTHDQEFINRFIREARSASRLHHQNIITIYDVGNEQNFYFISMEYLEGRTLSDVIRASGPLEDTEIERITAALADGLEYAHKNGVVHRDIKSANIFITNKNNPVLMDFGIAKAADSGTKLTQTGTVIGTPEYMSPEQAQGLEPGPAGDIYSLGVVMFEMATRQVPFQGTSPLVTLNSIINDPPPSPRSINSEISVKLENVILRCLAKNHEDRFHDCKSLIDTFLISDKKTKHYKYKPVKKVSTPVRRINKKSRVNWLKFAISTISLALIILVGLWMYQNGILSAIGIGEPGWNNLSDIEKSRVEAMLERGAQQYISNKITSPRGDNVYETYQQVLKIHQQNKEALEGLQVISRDFETRIKEKIREGDNNEASRLINKFKSYFANNPEVKHLELRNKVAPLEWLIKEFVKRNQLTEPSNRNAYTTSKQVLHYESKNKLALNTLAAIESTYTKNGNELYKSKSWEESRQKYLEALRLFPNNKLFKKRFEESLKNHRSELEKSFKVEGEEYMQNAEWNKAINHYKKALEQFSSNKEFADKLSEAETKLAQLNRENTVKYLLSQANSDKNNYKWNSAVEKYDRVLRLKPGNNEAIRGKNSIPNLIVQYADGLVNQRKYSQAIQQYKEALKYKPGDTLIKIKLTKAESMK